MQRNRGKGWAARTRRWVLGAAWAMSAALAAAAAHAEEIRIGGTGAALGGMQLLAQAFSKLQPDVQIKVLPSMGSGGGLKALMAGAVHVAVSSRPLQEAELRAGLVAQEYARTPFVFAVGSGSPLKSVTTADLVDLYSGKTETWPDGTRVRLVLRPVGDSDSELIKSMSEAMRRAKSAAEERKGLAFTVTDQDTASAIEKTPGGLGPSTLALILSERRALRPLLLDGVEPSVDNIAQGRYRLVKSLMLVTGPTSPPAAQAFAAFARSPAGRQILQSSGHWPR